jgi:hypothetical protein
MLLTINISLENEREKFGRLHDDISFYSPIAVPGRAFFRSCLKGLPQQKHGSKTFLNDYDLGV